MGRPVLEFWDLTPREIQIAHKGFAEAKATDLDLAYYTAWHAGVFSQPYKQGKFPDYRKHHPRRPPAHRKSADELKAVARSFTAALGGTIRKR